jgi:hypothetical protein
MERVGHQGTLTAQVVFDAILELVKPEHGAAILDLDIPDSQGQSLVVHTRLEQPRNHPLLGGHLRFLSMK